MKRLVVALAVLGALSAGQAIAADSASFRRVGPLAAPQTAPAPSSAASAAGSALALASAAPDADAVNPFNGKPLSVEQTQRELEAMRLHTQGLEERLKQLSLAEELRTLPARKALDLEKTETAVRKEQLARKELEAKANPPAPPAPVVVRPVEPPKVEKTPEPVAVPPPVIRLVSLMRLGDSTTALIDVNGRTLIAQDGEETPLGKVRVLNDTSVTLGNRTLDLHTDTVGRVVISDAPAATDSRNGSARTAQAVNQPVAVPPPPATVPAPQLPPLQLPPGVKLR